jgi:RNA polymerase sigma-70 factor (ECF subfamily)
VSTGGTTDFRRFHLCSIAWRYSEGLESASSQSAELNTPESSCGSRAIQELSGLAIDEFWRAADADSVGLGKDELARVLLAIGVKYNYGLAPGVPASRAQVGAFWRALQLQDLALAHACALARDAAWQQFMARFRESLTQAATGIAGSAALGQDLADSLYSEMFGLTERDGQRRSPLALYSGRGSLKGFLRATLAQRHIDHHRRTGRETPLTAEDLPAPPAAPIPTLDVLSRLGASLTATLGALPPEDRFLLSAWFLDRRTLLEISHTLRVHEATVSRKVKRLTSRLHEELLGSLRESGLSKAAALEALGTDPRDLDINLRNLLQISRPDAFLQQGAPADAEQA